MLDKIIYYLKKWRQPSAKSRSKLTSNTIYVHGGVIITIADDGTFLFSMESPDISKGPPVILTFNAYHMLKLAETEGPHIMDNEYGMAPEQRYQITLYDQIRLLKGDDRIKFLSQVPDEALLEVIKEFEENNEFEICAVIQRTIDERKNKEEGRQS